MCIPVPSKPGSRCLLIVLVLTFLLWLLQGTPPGCLNHCGSSVLILVKLTPAPLKQQKSSVNLSLLSCLLFVCGQFIRLSLWEWVVSGLWWWEYFLLPTAPMRIFLKVYFLFYSMFWYQLYLYYHCGISLLQKVHSYQTGTEPALQYDDVTHHLFVKSVLKQLPLFFLEEHLNRWKGGRQSMRRDQSTILTTLCKAWNLPCPVFSKWQCSLIHDRQYSSWP